MLCQLLLRVPEGGGSKKQSVTAADAGLRPSLRQADRQLGVLVEFPLVCTVKKAGSVLVIDVLFLACSIWTEQFV